MINVGLIGFGLAGRVLHAPLIAAAGMRITAVVTVVTTNWLRRSRARNQ